METLDCTSLTRFSVVAAVAAVTFVDTSIAVAAVITITIVVAIVGWLVIEATVVVLGHDPVPGVRLYTWAREQEEGKEEDSFMHHRRR